MYVCIYLSSPLKLSYQISLDVIYNSPYDHKNPINNHGKSSAQGPSFSIEKWPSLRPLNYSFLKVRLSISLKKK